MQDIPGNSHNAQSKSKDCEKVALRDFENDSCLC